MRNVIIFTATLALLLAAALSAQYYPRRGPAAATATAGPYNGPAVTFHGTLKALNKKELVVDLDKSGATEDQQSLTFRFSKKTKFLDKDNKEIKPAGIALGTHILVDATREGDLKLLAVNVLVAPPAVTVHP